LLGPFAIAGESWLENKEAGEPRYAQTTASREDLQPSFQCVSAVCFDTGCSSRRRDHARLRNRPPPGGVWHFGRRASDGAQMEMRGEYREIAPPQRLVSTEYLRTMVQG